MKQLILALAILISFQLFAHTPQDAPLPEKFEGLDNTLLVQHFPSPVYASTDPSQKAFKYFWKHTTSILSNHSDTEIIECGAYIFYNQQWNLRVTYQPKDFAKLFDCPNAILKQGQPYTFKDNWRTDNRLAGGWAMWYVIGKDSNGKKVVGFEKLETVGALFTQETTTESYQLAPSKSKFSWKGKSAFSNYTLSGNLNYQDGMLHINDNQVSKAEVSIDMTSLRCENDMVTSHLKNSDFFQVDQHPKASLKITQAFPINKRKQQVQGELTIKGITKPIMIPITLKQTDMGIFISGKLNIDRTAFGITYNSPDHYPNLKDQAIANEFEVEFEMVYVLGNDY